MGFLEEVKIYGTSVRRSKMTEIQEKLSAEDYAEFLDVLGDYKVSQASIVKALQRRNIHIGKGTISEMRSAYINRNMKVTDDIS